MRFRLLVVVLIAALTSGWVFAQPAEAQFGVDLTQRQVQGTLADGGSFVGDVTITGLAYRNGTLLANGVVTGQATLASGQTRHFSEIFTGVPLQISDQGVNCDAVRLDLGTVQSSQLTVGIDPEPFFLDSSAVPGAGNVGILMCQAAGLLRLGLSEQQVALLITPLLDAVNQTLPGQIPGAPQGRAEQQPPAPAAGRPAVAGVMEATISEIANRPSAFIGQTVTVTGLPTEPLGPRSFVLEDDDFLASDEVPVIASRPLMRGGQPVDASALLNGGLRVTGTVHQFNVRAFEDRLGVDLNDQAWAEFAGRPAIIATSIRPASSGSR